MSNERLEKQVERVKSVIQTALTSMEGDLQELVSLEEMKYSRMKSVVQFIGVNADNEKLSDKDFRDLVKRSIPADLLPVKAGT